MSVIDQRDRLLLPCLCMTAEEMVLTSLVFSALTESLCSHNRAGAVKRIRRMGISKSRATFTHSFRVSISALVLSVMSTSVSGSILQHGACPTNCH